MARPIMDVMQENVHPVSVSNALYEMMLDWRAATLMKGIASKAQKPKLKLRRQMLEKDLSRFFGVDHLEMRKLLENHFNVEEIR